MNRHAARVARAILLEAFHAQWTFIRDHQIDRAHGEWHAKVSPEGIAEPGQAKASYWKAAYHNGRALLNVIERLRALDRQPG